MQNAITKTNFQIPGLSKVYTGKVRDVYTYEYDGIIYLFIVVTDRISALDRILQKGIPFKGQILNQISSKFLDIAEENGISTWKINDIHPMITVGVKAQPIMVEMVVRSFLTGSSYRDIYSKGGREICGISLPDDMVEFQQFEEFLVTPTTKAVSGHDQNISSKEIIQQGLATQKQYDEMESMSLNLFEIGTEYAEYSGLILVDTKYEFGIHKGKVILIDEIHTPDSSRYWYEESYFENFTAGKAPRALDKEFVRQWLIQQGFKGDEGQIIPEMPEEFIQEVSDRYKELYKNIMGEELDVTPYSLADIETAIKDFIDGLEQMENPVEEIEE